MFRVKMIAVLITGLFGIDSVATAQFVTTVSPAGSEHTDGDLVVFPFFSPFPTPRPSHPMAFAFRNCIQPPSTRWVPVRSTSRAWRGDRTLA